MKKKREYDKENYELDKPSSLIHSQYFRSKKVGKRKSTKEFYQLSPNQFDILNLMMYTVNKSFKKEFKSTENLINIIKTDYPKFENKVNYHRL